MSDFNTFEMIIKYYDLLEKSFKISEMENSILYIIANKKDKKVLLDLEQVNILKEFLKKSNFIFYEISTRSYFNFDKFFIEFILKSLSRDHQELIKEDNFKSDLEKIADDMEEVEKSYAVQAGRELRVIVKPEKIDDMQSIKVARDIKNKIEETLQYPGTIKVVVIRETRVTEEAK